MVEDFDYQAISRILGEIIGLLNKAEGGGA